jgi:hypothetical protein
MQGLRSKTPVQTDRLEKDLKTNHQDFYWRQDGTNPPKSDHSEKSLDKIQRQLKASKR